MLKTKRGTSNGSRKRAVKRKKVAKKKVAARNRIKESLPNINSTKSAMLEVPAPQLDIAEFWIEGTTIYCQHRFSEKVKREMRATQEAGSAAQSKKKRTKKDFKALYEAAKYISDDGWNGIPASAFRNALISACRVSGIVMKKAKLSVWVEPDGFDRDDGTPLVRIRRGKPFMATDPAKNSNGSVDLRSRPKWKPGWRAKVLIQFDRDQLEPQSVANLLMRAGLQVGIGEGRNDSKNSNGMGWGAFKIVGS